MPGSPYSTKNGASPRRAPALLQVISSSPGDLQPVFQSMLENAVHICDAKFGNIYRWDGNDLHLVATHNTPPAFAEARRRSPGDLTGRSATTKTVVHVADAAAERAYSERNPTMVATVELGGVRTFLAVPMLQENELIGVFSLARPEVRPFTDKQIALVTSFAAQAVRRVRQNPRTPPPDFAHELSPSTANSSSNSVSTTLSA
jgi:GAF domain-containing protein